VVAGEAKKLNGIHHKTEGEVKGIVKGRWCGV